MTRMKTKQEQVWLYLNFWAEGEFGWFRRNLWKQPGVSMAGQLNKEFESSREIESPSRPRGTDCFRPDFPALKRRAIITEFPWDSSAFTRRKNETHLQSFGLQNLLLISTGRFIFGR